MTGSLSNILEKLPEIREGVRMQKELLLANLVMVSEIPAPTFGEEARIRFLQDRFSECGLQNTSTDERGNGLGILAGRTGERTILVAAHADTLIPEKSDHTVTMLSDRVQGLGVTDNSLGLAVVASLPNILEALDIHLDANLILMGASQSLGRGNLGGLRFFLSHNEIPLDAAICVEAMQLGRLSYTSVGMLRGDVTCRVPAEYDWTRFGAMGSITILNEVINRIVEIKLPKRPLTSIVFGRISGGTTYGRVAPEATLGFEIRSEAPEMVQKIGSQIKDIAGEVSGRTRAEVVIDIFASRKPGGIAYAHPLCRATRKIMKALDIKPRISPSMSELAALIDAGVPAVTLGITEGANALKDDEAVSIEPMYSGVAQLIGTLMAIDGGCCDGS
jgi:di/tripeptidase